MDAMATLRVLLAIALRNIFTHKVTSLIVGSIVLFGTFLVVLGTALLDSIESSMQRSITSSFVGHLQVHSAAGRDRLAVFGDGFMAMNDIGELRDFAPIKAALEAVPNVRAVVPMGQELAQVQTANAIDDILVALRAAVDAAPSGRALESEQVRLTAQQLRGIAADMTRDYENRLELTRRAPEIRGILADLARIDSDAFWSELAADPEPQLMFLETHLAPLYEEAQLIFLRILGTDLDRFPMLFDRFVLAGGKRVPPHTRGLMISKYMHERWLKNKVARDLDQIKRQRDNAGETIADDPLLADIAKHLPGQYQTITVNVDAQHATALQAELQRALGREGDLDGLVRELLTVDDADFDARYALFYSAVAPRMKLHMVRIGDLVTLRAFTKSGYLKSVNVKFYGTFEFQGLEGSDLAGSQNLLDIMSFRDLYGIMTPEHREELAQIKAQVGLAPVSREDAEAALFGGGEAVVAENVASGQARFDEQVDIEAARREARSAPAQTFDPLSVDAGLALNAAVLLSDATRIGETKAEIERLSAARGLGLKVVDWQTASGIVGQFVIVVRIVLYVAIIIIFLVALVIINNSMVMATMERVGEIGTMRAIGAQRGFVLLLFLFETMILGLASGLTGAGLGAAAVTGLGYYGLPAPNDILTFLFSGPRLYPTFGPEHLVVGVAAILLVSLASTLYPARVATRIQPVVAMQGKG